MQEQSDKSFRLALALRRFEEANAEDPNCEEFDGKPWPKEQLYARRVKAWVARLVDNPSEVLILASHCQHLRRWSIPRETYPATKPGYLKWRADLKKFHAIESGTILRECGYEEQTIAAVQALNLKTNFPADPESRVLEDALCLVFLEFQMDHLASKTSEEKMINALQKSWKKMTETARQHALKLNFTPPCRKLIASAHLQG